jgi:hypothetical protein
VIRLELRRAKNFASPRRKILDPHHQKFVADG